MRVSLARHGPAAAGPRHPAPSPLLAPRGARIVLGHDGGTNPIRPAADTLFGPRGVCLVGPDAPLIVSDTGHHRLLIWTRRPATDHVPADILIGQRAFGDEARNGGGEVGAATLNVPTGVAYGSGVLAVADAWNHRVLLWHGCPDRSHRPADIVLGQPDTTSNLANRGRAAPSADTLHWCYGVLIHRGRLFVADTGNRRVLVWCQIPQSHGEPADLVLGQRDFITRDDRGGRGDDAVGMRWPHGLAVAGDRLLVADAGMSRIMVWESPPRSNGTPSTVVLGQADFAGCDHNGGAYDPTAACLAMPYGIAADDNMVLVADTANSRLLGFSAEALVTGAAAQWLTGQPGFTAKGDNRWGPARRDSLCWPYGIAACGPLVAVADSGNNRVLLWDRS